jgi:uncharacterized protein (TIGR03085 family)
MHLARRLRHTLSDTARDLGPDAPTLCDPWSVRDLLAHLVVRERRPDVLPGVVLGSTVFGRHTERVQAAVAEHDFAELVDRVRSGPPAWSPTSVPVLDERANTTELLVHLEDVRRAQPGWAPAPADDDVDAAAWKAVTAAGRLHYRSAPVGVVLVAPGRGRALVRRPPTGRSSVVVTGAPLELLLHAFGRTAAAHVQLDGEPQAVSALTAQERSV